MEQKEMSVIGKIWWVIYPALLYSGVRLASQLLVSVAVLIIGLAQGTIIPGTSQDTSYGSPLMNSIIYGSTILGGVITIFLGNLFMKRDTETYGLIRDKLKRGPALSWVAVILISVYLFCLDGVITGLTENFSPEYHQQSIKMLEAMGKWYYIISAVVFAPIVEEIICRGLIFKRLRSLMEFLPAALSSGVIFGVIHDNIVYGISSVLIAIVFAYIYEKKQSLFASIIAHIIVNGINAAMMFLPEQSALKFTEFYQGNNMIIITIISAVICVAGMFLLKKTNKDSSVWQVKTVVKNAKIPETYEDELPCKTL
jgi:membrane protease YdiL (CAAX protease family)